MTRTCFAVLAALGLTSGTALAADHRDGPVTTADPAADINDVFAFLSDDGANVNLIMTVFPDAANAEAPGAFSDAVQYVFHVGAGESIGALSDQVETRIICQFDAGVAECWAGDSEYVTGDASVEEGISSTTGDLRVFAGLRNDPFFFKLDGFNIARGAVRDAAAAELLTFDEFGCPALDKVTQATLVTALGTGDDFFAPLDTLAIVVQVPVALVNGGGDVLGIWASTHERAE